MVLVRPSASALTQTLPGLRLEVWLQLKRRAVLTGDPGRVQVPAWCEPEWRGLMEACWEVSPAARPSFRQLAIQLEKILEATP